MTLLSLLFHFDVDGCLLLRLRSLRRGQNLFPQSWRRLHDEVELVGDEVDLARRVLKEVDHVAANDVVITNIYRRRRGTTIIATSRRLRANGVAEYYHNVKTALARKIREDVIVRNERGNW